MNEGTDSTGQVIIEENKLPQICPEWVKISEIPHPALVPGFISRRECLPDGSIDPNTPSVTTQMTLLQASTLSPSLASVIVNIPSGLMCESIHRRQVKEAKEGEDHRVLKEGFVITHPPTHYMRASDPMLMPSVLATTASTSNNPMTNNAVAMANQTASELAAMNLLYGGVRGKAYLDSLESFIDSVDVKTGSKIEELLKDKLVKSEGACGFKILNLITEPQASDLEIDSTASLIDQNHQICRILNNKTLEATKRTALMERLQNNLKELMKECPEEIKTEKFKAASLMNSVALYPIKFMLDSVNEHYTPRGRCVLYKIPGHSLVTGKVNGMPPTNGRIGVYAYDPQGNQPFSRPDLSGEVAFSFRSADIPTEYEICFRMNARSGYGPVPGNPIVPVEIQLSHTFDLFDETKARDIKVKPIEAEFVRLEEVMRSVVEETVSLGKVQQSMRDVNESTFNSLKYLSVLTFLAFVGLNAYQIYYMKKFFKSKKLI